MAQDTKNSLGVSSPHEHEHEDLDLPPPSYDSALATGSSVPQSQSAAGPSNTTPSSSPRVIPLFAPAPNAEPLLGRNYVPPEQIKAIQWRQRGKYIESWDPKLSDPAVLYDFLRAQAMTPPKVIIRCMGMHQEVVSRSGHVSENGTMVHKRAGEMQNIVDFNFTVDLSDIIDHPSNTTHIQLYTVPPEEPTQRATHMKRYAATYAPVINNKRHHRHQGYQSLLADSADEGRGPLDAGRTMNSREQRDWNDWSAFRLAKGIPMWVKMQDVPEFWETRNKGKAALQLGGAALHISEDAGAETNEGVDLESGARAELQPAQPDLRQWCQKYCADRGVLKEFYLIKGLFGWDMEGVLTAVRGAIISTGYQSEHLSVTVEVDPHTVVVRPANLLSRALGNQFIYFLTWITLIYPLIWIMKQILPQGGAPYSVAVAHYGMKYYPPVPSTYPGEDVQNASDRLAALYKLHPELPENPVLQAGPKGVHYLVGRKEGEWFREWEDRIRMGVRTRFQGDLQGGVVGEGAGAELDGY